MKSRLERRGAFVALAMLAIGLVAIAIATMTTLYP